MRELSNAEVSVVSGAGWLGVSGETWGCAVGGAVGSYGGGWGAAAGCIAGSAIVNNWGGGGGSIGTGPAGAWYFMTRLN